MGLGRRITELRLKKKESLQDVASAVEVSKAHIWELEKGHTDNPSMALVTRLADHFGVSVAMLVGEDAKAKDAEYWINLSILNSKQELLNSETRFQSFKAFKIGEIAAPVVLTDNSLPWNISPVSIKKVFLFCFL